GGGFPSPLLIYATPEKLEEELKKFLDIAMKDGGYIFSLSAGINGAKEENVERMFKVLHDRGKC
ncbi:MAG: uroporphyrinogen decarboxylase, partial [Firmicutes bacterium]|nr:uroporphyrinogen decarboxylase [Bacillota bacterium]